MLGIPIIIGQAVLGRKKHQVTLYRKIEEMGQTPPLEELSSRSSGSLWAPVKEALRHANVRWAVALCFLFLWGEAGVVTFLTMQFKVQIGSAACRDRECCTMADHCVV